MEELKMKITRKQYLGMVAEQASITKVMVDEVLKACEEVNKSVVLTGNDLPILGIGYTAFSTVKAKPQRTITVPKIGEIEKDAENAYSKLTLKVGKEIKEGLREITDGKPYEKEKRKKN